MRETKLYRALVQLNGHELNKLHRFILSPYFNSSQLLISLFEWIKEDLKTEKKQEYSKMDLWIGCFGKDEIYDDTRFRKLQSDLLRLIEEFYAQEVFESNPIHKAKYLLEAINNRNLEELQVGTLKSSKRLVEEQALKPASYYYYKYEIEQSTYNLLRTQAQRSSKSNIEEIAENLDRFYLAEKLRYYTLTLTHQHLTAVNYKMLFTDEILEHVRTHDYSDVPAILIYYQIMLTHKEPVKTEHYELLKQYINQYIHFFPKGEARDILEAVLNYGIIRMNAGEERYIREVFDLFCQSLNNKLLIVKGQIDPFVFKNIVTAGLRLGEFDWVENFIGEYSPYLDEKYRENAITFNLAQLYFYKKEYSKVIEQLRKVEYEDFTYNLNSKTLLMASYYELDEFEALNSLLDSFRLYVDRNKVLTKGKGKHYKTTISIVRRLAKIIPGEVKEIEKLREEVLRSQGIVSRNWILEKLDTLGISNSVA